MPGPKGSIAALLIGKAKPAPGPEQSPTLAACQAVLDAVKADSAQQLDDALGQWMDAYEQGEGGEGGEESKE